jgi:DNA mismatch repair protein MutS
MVSKPSPLLIGQTGHITQLSRIEEDRYVWLDRFTVRNLELYGSINEGAKTLVDILDKTISPMGARLLKRWIAFPLKDVKPINERLSVVEFFFKNPELKELLEQNIALIGDLERIISKVAVWRRKPELESRRHRNR